MILSDTDIEQRMQRGDLKINNVQEYEAQIQPASFDFRLSDEFRTIDKDIVIDLYDEIPDEKTTLHKQDEFTLSPGDFVLGSTVEWLEVPRDLVASVEGRSSIGRLAVDVHATAGHVDPGYQGKITLEISNKGNNPVTLRSGKRIGQFVFMKCSSSAARVYDSKYQNQEGPVQSKIHLDEDT